ncbi:MAG: ferrous iron transport protein B [Bacteroidales bacterium]
MRLSELNNNQKGLITKVLGHGAFRKRITEMGFVRGKTVRVIKSAPLQDPVEYEILGYNISLRRSEAHLIEVIPGDDTTRPVSVDYEGTLVEETGNGINSEKGNVINVALVGNPNSGKTTLFNHASGSREKVGNYGGVTVDAKEAAIRKNGFIINITDLPGTYSITEYTPEELFVRDHIISKMPDVVVNVIDASNLERNLFLTTQLIDMNIRVIIALNMYDELEQKGISLDHQKLGKLMGIPIIPTVAVKGLGIDNLVTKITEVFEDKDPVLHHIHINYGSSIEQSIASIQSGLKKNKELTDRYSSRYLAIRLLENDKTIIDLAGNCSNHENIIRTCEAERNKLEKEFKDRPETVITDAKYGFISGALGETCIGCQENTPGRKRNYDVLLTHKVWGYPVFLAIMWLMFQATFTLGSYPMNWIEKGVDHIGNAASGILPSGFLHDLVIDGIVSGVGGVIIFLPNILILFFFISLMEDTGYMARVSFIMDKLMHKIGLHGKSFIPLLMGFGCNVPAIMATRTLENKKDRIITMMIIPFMSCSARLPVYVLIISAFFQKYQGLVLFSIYITGIIFAALMAIVLNKTLFSKQDIPFVMELPPYRIPTIKNTFRHMWFKGSQYLRKMGTVILVASVIIWALGYYPRKVNFSADYDGQIAELKMSPAHQSQEAKSKIRELELSKKAEQQEQSYIGRLGRFIEPAIKPLGFDWKIGISIITGFAAKEIVVGSMSVLYHADTGQDEDSSSLVEKLRQQEHVSGSRKGEKVFTPVVAFGFMLFVLIYSPCVAAITAIRKESNRSWALFSFAYTTILAWVVAFIVYQAGFIAYLKNILLSRQGEKCRVYEMIA